MKKKICIGIGIGFLTFLCACSNTVSVPESQNSETGNIETDKEEMGNTKAETAETETAADDTAVVIESILDMLGKTDEQAADMLGGGELNQTDDGILIGRLYEVELFGEQLQAGTLYDENGEISVVTMQLNEPDAEAYRMQLTDILGEPEKTDTQESESGSTATVWKEEKGSILLYQSYGLVSLEFQKLP